MPHEKINHPRRETVAHAPGVFAPEPHGIPDPEQSPRDPRPPKDQLVVGWNKIGWVQVSVYPEGWKDTGDADHVNLNPQELDLLIKTLRRAKRQAYSKGNRHVGYEDGPEIETRPLFNRV